MVLGFEPDFLQINKNSMRVQRLDDSSVPQIYTYEQGCMYRLLLPVIRTRT